MGQHFLDIQYKLFFPISIKFSNFYRLIQWLYFTKQMTNTTSKHTVISPLGPCLAAPLEMRIEARLCVSVQAGIFHEPLRTKSWFRKDVNAIRTEKKALKVCICNVIRNIVKSSSKVSIHFCRNGCTLI